MTSLLITEANTGEVITIKLDLTIAYKLSSVFAFLSVLWPKLEFLGIKEKTHTLLCYDSVIDRVGTVTWNELSKCINGRDLRFVKNNGTSTVIDNFVPTIQDRCRHCGK